MTKTESMELEIRLAKVAKEFGIKITNKKGML